MEDVVVTSKIVGETGDCEKRPAGLRLDRQTDMQQQQIAFLDYAAVYTIQRM